jgi:hypothetical protein
MRLSLAIGLCFVFCSVASGQDPAVRVQAVDTFPAALGYAVVAAVSTGALTLTGVITKLYFALMAEKDARREEAERLLRESQAIMKETLTIMAEQAATLTKLSDAVHGCTGAVQGLMKLIGER